MSTPNPLIPQGTFQAQAAKGASNVRLAVATIVAIHVVFFGGLLLQGCKRDTQTTQTPPNEPVESTATNDLALPPLESSSLYYTNPAALPAEAPAQATSAAPSAPSTASTSPETIWQPTNLTSPLGTGALDSSAPSSTATKEYTVVRGDSFSRIASRHGTTIRAIQAANPGVDPVKIQPGDKLNIPEGSAQRASSQTQGRLAESSGNIYTVKPRDTLTKIAREHNITISQLRAANDLRTSRVNVGQKLKIPSPSGGQATGTTSALPRSGL